MRNEFLKDTEEPDKPVTDGPQHKSRPLLALIVFIALVVGLLYACPIIGSAFMGENQDLFTHSTWLEITTCLRSLALWGFVAGAPFIIFIVLWLLWTVAKKVSDG